MRMWAKLALLGLLVMPAGLRAADVAVLTNGFAIRHERREVVGSSTRLFVHANDESFVDVPTGEIVSFEKDDTPAPAEIASKTAEAQPLPGQPLPRMIDDISGRHHLDPDFVNSVIHAESNFNSHAVSPKGAQGLMQLMPGTASRLGVENSFDAGANVEGGTRYLRELLERYNFDVVKALAAYNAGPGRVEQYHGVPPYYETQAYVARIIRDFNRKKLAEKKAATLKKAASKNASMHSVMKSAVATQASAARPSIRSQ
jgi:soluble lytic murein transglycosylase-like protein